jgi:uncharacterized protein
MKNWDLLCHTIIQSLKENLAPFLTYHDWKHTEHVMQMSEFIARKENISENDILLVKTAALFHDAGFITTISDGHEEESIRLAKEKLPEFDYSTAEIELIAGMIRATSIPQKPNTKLECILADADLEYLGTDSFERIGNNLFRELKHFNPNLDLIQWNEIQIKFLQSHSYHTPYCIEHRAPIKEKNMTKLIEGRENLDVL